MKVSNAGGVFPLWLGNGQKLFYLAAGPALLTYIAVPVEMDPAFDAQNPLEWFKWLYFKSDEGRIYDVSPNGQRFLAINPVPLETDADASLPDLVGCAKSSIDPPGRSKPPHWDSARWFHHCARKRA